ncbi:MAG: ATP-binding protein, partial [Alphaproteobacteria bacterium]|nr:ATP-binding protein [Alphaproteobacteria bacterium]
MATDITERKEAEKRLQESEERLRQTTKLARIGYYVWDAVEDRYPFCSDEHARLHGLSPEEFMARAASFERDDSFTHPDDLGEFWRAMKDLRSGKPIEIEYRTVTESGKTYHVREIAESVFDEAGRVVREIGASQDVTDLHHAEERLRQAQKMEAVGQLTGGIAHDFNNLLAVIIGNAEIVEEQLGGGDKSAQAIIRAADRGAELTRRLLAFSRRQPLHSEEIDLEQLTHGMGHLLRRSLGETIEVEISSASGLWSALADHGQVENALLNLAINARDAMPDGGKLIIAAANETLDENHVTSQSELSPGDYVVLSVSDTGIGMTPEVLDHVFEPFYTTKEVGEGSGLGLSMVYGFAKQSGGCVFIRSEPG